MRKLLQPGLVLVTDEVTGWWAEFSEDETKRYALGRPLTGAGGIHVSMSLNPSTADAFKNDPTVLRDMTRAQSMGASLLVKLNIGAHRATDPKDWKSAADPIGPLNDERIEYWVRRAELVICSWGTHGKFRDRDLEVLRLLRRLGVKPKCLGLSKEGHPKHPLYLKKDTPLIDYVGRAV